MGGVRVRRADTENDQMQKSEVAWKTAARLAALADEAEDPEERDYHSGPLLSRAGSRELTRHPGSFAVKFEGQPPFLLPQAKSAQASQSRPAGRPRPCALAVLVRTTASSVHAAESLARHERLPR